MTLETTETITTEDVSTTQETADTTSQDTTDVQDTSEETSQDTDSTDTVTDDGGTGTKTPDFEKSFKELQPEFTRVTQELAKMKEQVETLTAKPSIVEPATGAIKPEIVQYYAQQIKSGELTEYRNALHRLDPEAQTEVSSLLSNYQATGDQTYLNQAKDYFASEFVSEVERLKMQRAYEVENYLKSEQSRNSTESRIKFNEGIKAEAPTALKFIDKDSEFYCPELEEAIGNAMGYSTPAEVETTVKNVMEACYKLKTAELKTQDTIRKEASKLKPPQGGSGQGASTKSTDDMTQQELEQFIEQQL